MNEFRFYSLLKSKLEDLNEGEKFIQYALNFAQAPYVWGGESLTGTDCSGLVCGPLLFMGYDIRCTADDLLKNVSSMPEPDGVELIFFINSKSQAKHVGVFVSDSVVLHASGERGVTFDYDTNLVVEYRNKGFTEVYMRLDFDKCAEYSGNSSGKDEDYA